MIEKCHTMSGRHCFEACHDTEETFPLGIEVMKMSPSTMMMLIDKMKNRKSVYVRHVCRWCGYTVERKVEE